ncbi:hypothetical protein ES703_29115 [subsurface metagenome]
MEELFAKKLYYEYDVDRGLSEIDYIQLVKDVYMELTRTAREGSLVLYGDLGAFRKLKGSGYKGNELLVILGAIVGACSEYEAANDRPLLSSIVINRDTRKPGSGFFYLSTVPPALSRKNWEDNNVRPPEIVMRQRDAFWLHEVQKVHEWWQKQPLNKGNG